MTLAALIRKNVAVKVATATPATFATDEGDKGRTVASVATVAVANPPEEKTATASRWWLVHYPDREPGEVWTDPPATHAEILERHTDAIAAIKRDSPDLPARACKTCAHVTGRGGCGEPVAAGLSAVVGVIRYHPDRGATCTAWLATISRDLEAGIRAMAGRWGYSDDDLAEALAGARRDPAGWRRVVDTDDATKGGNHAHH